MQWLRTFPVLLALVAGSESTCRGPSGSAGQAPAGSSAPAGDVELPGVDTGSLTPRERREWSTYVSELLAPCPNEPVSVAQCVRESRKCAKCLPAARLLVRQVREGRSRSQAEEAFYARFSADRIKSIDLADAASRGPVSAPITVVEFADFECPHCRLAAPMLEELVTQYPGMVRFIFKTYPLSAHPHGESAARAAYAAGRQGKFWEMHHTMFEHQQALEPRDLEKYAKEIGLDVAKWKADYEAPAIVDQVARDRKQGDQLGLTGTPTVFINGREYKFTMGDDLQEWIRLEIELTTGAPAPPPAGGAAPASASASAPSSASPPPAAGSALVKASEKKKP